MLGTISSKVTATPGPSGWAQVHDFAPDDSEKLRLRGRLFAVVATSGVEGATASSSLSEHGESNGGIDTIAAGRELIGRLHEEYFGTLDTKPFDALRSATQKVVDEFRGRWGDVEIAACTFVNGVIYSVATGGTQVVICRDGALATILASSSEVVSASGYPKEGDLMLLASKSFFEKISVGVIKAALTSGSTESAAETFAPLVHGAGEVGTLGAVVVKFDGRKNIFNIPEETRTEPLTTAPSPRNEPNIKRKLADFIEKLGRKLPRRNIYIRSGMGDEVTSQSRKLTFSIGVILLFILVVSIGFGIRQKKINDIKKKYQGILTIAQNDVDQAISLASVNPDKSRELFIDSEQKLEEITSLKVNDPKITDLQKKIDESRGAILGEYDAFPELFMDLSLLSSGFNGDTTSASNGNIYVLDKNGKRVVSIAMDTKKSKVVAGPAVIDSVYDVASYQDNVFILAVDGIYQVGLTKTKVVDKTWTGDAFISAFAGNLYVLDKVGNEIYRYSGLPGNTFGTQQKWLAAGTNANFGSAISWGMDGAIYVLYPNSKVLKYSLGSPQNFAVTGVIPEIGNIDAIAADPDNQYLYLLDKAGKRVVVVDKKGKYKAQYINDQIAGAVKLVVSEAQKKIILLTGDKLLLIKIRHL